MPLSQAAQNYLDDLSTQPAARQPATVGEIWDSEWKRTGLDTIEGVGKPLVDARTNLVTAIEGATGKNIVDYAAEQRIQLNPGGFDRHVKALNDLADTLPDEARTTINPLRDVRRNAVIAAQKTERDASDVSAATYGLSGTATAWAAGIARQTVSPANIAAMIATAPIGGPVSGGVLKYVGGQAIAGMTAQAAVEPLVQSGRAELGLESGFGRAAGDIVEAGVGGAAVAGVGVGLHHVFRAARDSYSAARPAEAAVQPSPETPIGESPAAPVGVPVEAAADPHPNLTPEDFDAAAMHAERDAVTNAPPGADPIAHAQGVHDAQRVMEDGKPPFIDPEAAPVVRPDIAEPAPREPELPLKPQPEPKGPPADSGVAAILEQNAVRTSVEQLFDPDNASQRAAVIAKDGTIHEFNADYGWSGQWSGKGAHARFNAEGDGSLPQITAYGKSVSVFAADKLTPAQKRTIARLEALSRRDPTNDLVLDVQPPEQKEPEIIGDPALARDVESRLAALPDADTRMFHIEQPDKSLKSGTAKTFLKEITDDAKAVRELIDCIGKEPA